jgi:hypothetical protein
MITRVRFDPASTPKAVLLPFTARGCAANSLGDCAYSYEFVIAVGRTKGAESLRVKCWATTPLILAVLSASLALAEDFKTINGKVYKDATISRVEADGIVLRSKRGISKVYFIELPKDVQERFHYGPAKPVTAPREREPIKLDKKQDGPSQAAADGRAAAIANPAAFIKVLVAATIIIAGVVLAIVRSRF